MVLPIVLVLLAGLWLLTLSILATVSVSQRAGRIRLDTLQAELAVHAGLEHAIGLLQSGCDDDCLIICEPPQSSRQASRLYLVTPSAEGGELRYEYQPLFSIKEKPAGGPELVAPEWSGSDSDVVRLRVQPWIDPIEVEWLPIRDDRGRTVARHSFWVEDLEARLDPSLIGMEAEGPIRFEAMDASPGRQHTRDLLAGRDLMCSPESSLAAAGLRPPMERWSLRESSRLAGHLKDPWGAFLETGTTVGLQTYEEQARVPHARGISPLAMGQPKLNLNRLLHDPPERAVPEMAEWIGAALPDFDMRQGGFPENYLETLAANALDYADRDSDPRVMAGRYRGVDGQPFLSEVVLHLHFQGLVREEDRWVLKWSLRLFAELWNLSSMPIESGWARLSYEVNLRPTAVGVGGSGRPFDSPELLEDATQAHHELEKHGERYLTPAIEINLRPDEYRFLEFAKVDYSIECRPQFDAAGRPLPEWFDLVELESEARGLSLIWNGREVERLHRIHRDPHGLADFRTDRRRKTAKACIPALNYGTYTAMLNNPGDPRISHYLRGLPLGENAYPENMSPHRRNIRRRNIYDRDPSPRKTRHYGRVMPSQWPDGGHDSITGDFRVTTSDARFPTDPEWWPHSDVPTPSASHAPQRISNRGRFLQTAELGRIHDPLMWTPAYPDLEGLSGSGSQDTAELTGRVSVMQRPVMPLRRDGWPEVSWSSLPSHSQGGGNTLRIGRPEHARFDQPGLRASHLLDLFHCGQAESESVALRQGPTNFVAGRVNLNTASREVLRCLAYGALRQDEAIARIISLEHDTTHAFGPTVEPWQATEAQLNRVAERIADGIMEQRPFASLSEIAHIVDRDGEPLFGNRRLHEPVDDLQWSDAAAEESYARVHQAGGLRSRNFRVWIVGQKVRDKGGALKVLAESRRVVTLFVDPGQRGAAGQLIPENQKVRVLHGRDF